MGFAAIPLVLMAVSTVMQYSSQMSAAKAARNAANANAEAIQGHTNEEAYRTSNEMRRMRSLALANAGASGVEISGSQSDYLQDMLETQTHDVGWMFKTGAHRAAMSRWEGQQAYKAGRSQAITGLVGNVGSMFSMGVAGAAGAGAASGSQIGTVGSGGQSFGTWKW